MPSRTASRGVVRRSLVVSAAVLTCGALALTPASAAAAGVELAPTEFSVGLRTIPHPLASTPYGIGYAPVPVAFGGVVTFQLPSQLASPSATLPLSLGLATGALETPTTTYTSDSADPARLLAVTDLGAGRYQVALPADDGVSGSFGTLDLGPLAVTVAGADSAVSDPPWPWNLELSSSAPAAVELPTTLIATSYLGCGQVEAPGDKSSCAVQATATPGRTLDVSLPASSTLVGLGLPDLSRSAFSVTAFVPQPEDGMRISLTATLSADARTATVSLPADLRPGRYTLNSGVGDSTGRLLSVTYAVIEVAAPAVNPGLRSETGADVGASVPVALIGLTGAGAVATAGGLVVRTRRRTGSPA
ncbi:hypothetical protein [Modestobacter sp. VKM Ac-2984]|uniref:hypothetical protein n=1 Tax=Modestobacter sp. VKM Ac-2984 TaxID=3004138 RepID=UPI0022AB2F6B|nr:hypothetical protein [Modestobacter sp. VKM Ac-2984]MCZ2815037.1 hypothetical protein [Modestobacter sp. VKM Ac-2984]